MRRRHLAICVVLLAAIIGGAAFCYFNQPSLTRSFVHASVKKTYSLTVNGKPFNLPYRLLVPDDAANVPVLLYLGGSGQCGSDNTRQVIYHAGLLDELAKNEQKTYRCIVVVPQLPRESLATNADVLAGYMQLIKTIQTKYHADPSRLYVTGFSMGADSIWKLLEQYPHYIAAAVPISGDLGKVTQTPLFSEVPIWFFHGRLDFIYPVQKARDCALALASTNSAALYTEYPFASHICWQNAYNEPGFLTWLFSQSKK